MQHVNSLIHVASSLDGTHLIGSLLCLLGVAPISLAFCYIFLESQSSKLRLPTGLFTSLLWACLILDRSIQRFDDLATGQSPQGDYIKPSIPMEQGKALGSSIDYSML